MIKDQYTQPVEDANDALSPQGIGRDELASKPDRAPVSPGTWELSAVESPDEALLHISSFGPELGADGEPIPGATSESPISDHGTFALDGVGAPCSTESSLAEQEFSTREQPFTFPTAASQRATVTLCLRPVAVPHREFNCANDGLEIHAYTAWWKGILLFEVGYLKTPEEVFTSVRRSLEGKPRDNSSMAVINRPLFRASLVATRQRIHFVENEPTSFALNGQFGEMKLDAMIATTIPGAPGNPDQTVFSRYVSGETILLEGKEVVVIASWHPLGASHTAAISRTCAGLEANVK